MLNPVDWVALGLLGTFALWGVLRGSLRQVCALAVLALAFPVAARLGPRLEGTVVKAVSATGTDLPIVAWTAVFVGTILAGAVLLALLGPLWRRLRPRGAGERWLGALLGLLHGAAVLTVLCFVLLFATASGSRPAWVQDLEASQAARGARALAREISDVLPLPSWLRAALRTTDQRLESGAESRPREGTEKEARTDGA